MIQTKQLGLKTFNLITNADYYKIYRNMELMSVGFYL